MSRDNRFLGSIPKPKLSNDNDSILNGRLRNMTKGAPMEADALQGVVGGASANTVSFTLPSLPASLNILYEINRPDSGLPRKRLKAEWSLWVTRMMPYIPAFTVAENSILRVDRCYHLPWFYGNGRWRKVDVVNMDALLFNLVTRKIGIDDLYVKQGMLDSKDSTENKVAVTITEIPESEWRGNGTHS